MRTLSKNKQKMYYSLPDVEVPIYELDDDGNIIYDSYTDSDGNTYNIPRDTGEVKMGYQKPVEFKANIYGKLNNAIIRAFGADESDNHAQIVCEKGLLPFVIGTRIWRKNEPKYIDIDKTIVDENTAEYEVRGIMTEGLDSDMFYLVVRNPQ